MFFSEILPKAAVRSMGSLAIFNISFEEKKREWWDFCTDRGVYFCRDKSIITNIFTLC